MRHTASVNPRLSVIVPVGPGDDAWRALLPQLAGLPVDAELRLVACRAGDAAHDALAAAEGLPADRAWLLTPRGRATQMNAGARASRGDWLWFLHADSRFDDARAAVAALRRTAARDPAAIGYFDLRFAADGPAATAINTAGAWIRSRWLRLPFGDQGLFLARSTFERLGGFDESLPAAEDHALVWTARRAGVPLRAAGASIRTSARRYAEHGWWRTTARHLALTWRQAQVFSRAPDGPR
jgi:rSAM/selenodomain-associated transferase 2